MLLPELQTRTNGICLGDCQIHPIGENRCTDKQASGSYHHLRDIRSQQEDNQKVSS